MGEKEELIALWSKKTDPPINSNLRLTAAFDIAFANDDVPF